MPKDLRFGASNGSFFSQYWKVAPTAKRPELVVSGSRTGSFLHLTMHEDESHWHTKVTLPNSEVIARPWDPPREVLPGVRRLVQLLMPRATVRFSAPERSGRVVWYPAPSDNETWVEFTVLHCASGIPDIRGADVIGVTPMMDGTAVIVIARLRPGESGSHSIHAPDADEVRRQVREAGDVGTLIHGAFDVDGCLWFLELHSTAPNAQVGL